jgi:hypothetical protein
VAVPVVHAVSIAAVMTVTKANLVRCQLVIAPSSFVFGSVRPVGVR